VGLGERKDTMSSHFSLNIASPNQKVKSFPQNPSNFENFEGFSLQSLHSQFYLQSLQVVREALSHHLKPCYLHFKNDDENLTFRALKRGTEDYFEYFTKPKMRKIKERVKKLLRVKKRGDLWGWTNGLLITYTFKDEVLESWKTLKNFSALWERVVKRLEYRKIKILFGFKVVEAQESGKAHLHILIILNKDFLFRFDPARQRSFVKSQKQFEKFKKIFDLGLGWVDIQAISGEGEAVNYVSKYMVKNGKGVESILEKEGDLSSSEVKRVLGLYFLILFHLRQFSLLGEYRRLDKRLRYNNNSEKWERLQGEELREWIEFLSSLGLRDLAELGVKMVRGSPQSKIKIVF
jgi:hypothetical protein